MCSEAKVNGKSCSNQAEFQAAIGGDILVLDWNYDERGLGDDVCLCPIDIEATAYKYGFHHEYDGDHHVLSSRTDR